VGVVAQHREDFSPSPIRTFQHGFTLIELLVVLFIIGVVAGLAVVQFMPDDRAVLREEAERLALLLENAGLEARASGRSLAWSSEGHGYQFWKKNDYGDWVCIEDDAAFRPRTLPDGISINTVKVEGQPLQPGERIPLSAASFALPFSIRLSTAHAGASVTGNSTGMVTAALDGES
jgi:general secretion pathway protein H